MELVVGILAGLCVWTIFGRLLPVRDPLVLERVASLRLRGVIPAGKLPTARKVGAGRRSLLEIVGRSLPGDRLALERALAASGIARSSDSIVGARFVLAALGAFIGLAFAPLAVVTGASLALAGFKIPDALIKIRIGSRRDEIAASLPDAVDLLAVCTQAGLNLPLALSRISESTPGVLGEELRRTVRQIDLGVPRARALKELAERNEIEELRALVESLVSAGRFGTRIAQTLMDFSGEVRARRRVKAEEQARRAPVKILFPLVFLILPGFILLTLVPLILGTFATLGF